MKRYDQAWQRLVTAAQRAPASGDDSAPFGFATRVAALGTAARNERSMWARMVVRVSIGALATSCALATVFGALSYRSAQRMFAAEAAAPAEHVSAVAMPAATVQQPGAEPLEATAVAPTDDPVASLVDLLS